MGRLSILSLGLFILPIAITVSVLVGLETYRVSHGQKSIFPGDADNAVTTTTYCQKEYGITPDPGRFTCKSPCISPRLCLPGTCLNFPPARAFAPRKSRERQSVKVPTRLPAYFKFDTCANLSLVNPNQWGVTGADELNLCMNVRHPPILLACL